MAVVASSPLAAESNNSPCASNNSFIARPSSPSIPSCSSFDSSASNLTTPEIDASDYSALNSALPIMKENDMESTSAGADKLAQSAHGETSGEYDEETAMTVITADGTGGANPEGFTATSAAPEHNTEMVITDETNTDMRFARAVPFFVSNTADTEGFSAAIANVDDEDVVSTAIRDASSWPMEEENRRATEVCGNEFGYTTGTLPEGELAPAINANHNPIMTATNTPEGYAQSDRRFVIAT